MNRLMHQLARDGHLTFRKKWRDLVIQIFGHEGLYDNQKLADVGFCATYELDFYRLSVYEFKDLAWRKLLNPFKWVEFLVAAPLEFLAWGFSRLAGNIKEYLNHADKKDVSLGKAWLLILTWALLVISAPFVNLAVNLVTGLLRRVLAPARYLIRPSLELAKRRPKSFLAILGLTLGLAAFVAVSIFTGGLPFAAAAGIIFASLAAKIAVTAVATAAIWATLLKGVSVLRVLRKSVQKLRRDPSLRARHIARVDRMNGQCAYALNTIRFNKEPVLAELNAEHRGNVPLLIKCADRIWIYGAAPKNQTQLTEMKKIQDDTVNLIANAETLTTYPQVPRDVYSDIAFCRGHFIPRSARTTKKVSQALHGLNPKVTPLRSIERQDACYSFALFAGVEAFYGSKGKSKPIAASKSSDAPTQLAKFAS